jgi:tight adherence protein C
LPDLVLILVPAMLGLAAFLVVRTIYSDQVGAAVRQRLAEKRQSQQAAGRTGSPLRTVGEVLIEKLGRQLAGWVSPSYEARLNKKFVAMGRPELRAQDFRARQVIWLVFFGLFGMMLISALGRPLPLAALFAGFGFFFPHIWLRDQVQKRQRAIARALPYHIDLLTLSVEAGLDFQAALGTVVEKGKPGPLIEEFGLVLSEMKLGTTREEALRNLADRIQIGEISAFVSNLIQATKMGTSLGKVLRIQATQMRIARTQRAEKAANEAPVKMLMPLIFCIFPTVFAVLFGPIIYRVMYGGG